MPKYLDGTTAVARKCAGAILAEPDPVAEAARGCLLREMAKRIVQRRLDHGGLGQRPREDYRPYQVADQQQQ